MSESIVKMISHDPENLDLSQFKLISFFRPVVVESKNFKWNAFKMADFFLESRHDYILKIKDLKINSSYDVFTIGVYDTIKNRSIALLDLLSSDVESCILIISRDIPSNVKLSVCIYAGRVGQTSNNDLAISELTLYSKPLFQRHSLKFSQNCLGAFRCTYTVMIALFLRETYSLYGKSRFGYIWALLRDVFTVGLIIIIRMLIGIKFEKGLHIVYFVLCGFFIYFIVTDCISKCMTAIRANTAILSFPHVTPFDLMISRCIFVFFTNIQASIVVILIALYYDIDFEISNIAIFLYCIISAVLLGISGGIFLSSLAVFYPVYERIWPIAKRILLFLSAVFFSIDRIPVKYHDLISYNPILQLIEGLRSSISHLVVINNVLNVNYINSLILLFLVLGLLLQKLSYGKLNL
ncbi:ABC transporter permease [Succinimonas amylolytica]|uniref:ABC transporter permease n=1 Tax=Succinimonas amylolytica TaxID=83769 RepID=UPI000379ADDA|nr:ABC transporter permease [Succinimonas amylolytica]